MKDSVARKILKKVRQDYETIADDFDRTRQYLWSDLTIFDKYIKPDMKILDLGCGNGRLFDMIKQKNVQYLGIDNCARFIQIAQEKYVENKSQFLTGDVLDSPPDPGNYDIVFFIATLQHIPSKKLRNQALENVYRSLKPGGYLLMTNWNLWQSKYRKHIRHNQWMKLLRLSRLDWHDLMLPSWGNKIQRYLHAFTSRELKGIVRANKFNNIKQSDTGRNLITIAQKP